KPEKFQPSLIAEADFWKDVNFALAYRGNDGAGLKLTVAQEEKLLAEQMKLKSYLKQFISGATKFYSYPEDLGISGYVVFWGFTFLLLNASQPSILIYGSASD